ncbi:flagellin [Lachnospiraceae bacterium G11]|nr:flagellin [Lachnospiraceae bacterium G11]
MVVQHNLTAMNSNRMLGITTKSQAKATEKLSSGYKINRAADDAAGLSISEKMRKQIRGLTQASSNAQDGISAVQTAEGALTEVHDMLQRMNELAVKAANGTNSEDDRAYIQAEVDQLVTEIDRVSTTTKFNETYLLKGDHGDGTGTLSFTTADTNLASKIGGTDLQFDADGVATAAIATVESTTTSIEVATSFPAGDPSSDVTSVSRQVDLVSANTIAVTAADGTTVTNFKLYEGATDEALKAHGILDAQGKPVAGTQVFTSKESFLKAVQTAANETGSGDVKSVKIDGTTLTITAFADLNKGLDISLHVGADSTKDNKIGLTIEMMSARGLGINGIKVDGATDANATASIDVIKAAIQKVSEQRSALGAVQNRLEHTIANLDNIVENTQSAESAIRDTDMATQMVAYSNNNILAQAGQAMLAQANQSNQGVMSLLQ